MIPHQIVHRAMMITLACALLLSMAPTMAGAIGTTTTVKAVSQTVVTAGSREGGHGEGSETQGRAILLFISGP
jgi:hypothetical protein